MFLFLLSFFLFNFNSGNIFFITEEAVNDPEPTNSNKLSTFLQLNISKTFSKAFSEYSISSLLNEFFKISLPNCICSFFFFDLKNFLSCDLTLVVTAILYHKGEGLAFEAVRIST